MLDSDYDISIDFFYFIIIFNCVNLIVKEVYETTRKYLKSKHLKYI